MDIILTFLWLQLPQVRCLGRREVQNIRFFGDGFVRGFRIQFAGFDSGYSLCVLWRPLELDNISTFPCTLVTVSGRLGTTRNWVSVGDALSRWSHSEIWTFFLEPFHYGSRCSVSGCRLFLLWSTVDTVETSAGGFSTIPVFNVKMDLGSWNVPRPCPASGHCLRSTRKVDFLSTGHSWFVCGYKLMRQFMEFSDSISHISCVSVDLGS